MKVPDANLLIYAYLDAEPQHPAARRWLEDALASPEPVGIPLQSIAAFLRITTHPRLRLSRFTMTQAIAIVEQWLERPQVTLLLPTDRHWRLLRKTLLEGRVSGDLVTDAQIAALALEYGGVIQTNDSDFARFEGLLWQNPLR